MVIRNAEEKDIPQVLGLLGQVLEIHADLRPDIFIHGTTKYTGDELIRIFSDENRRTFVAVDDGDKVLGYVFCELKNQPESQNIVQFKSVYIDDLCVDSGSRGMHIGRQLFEYVKKEAHKLGCYEITLNVWEGNDSAKRFYDKMGMKPMETKMELII